MKFFTWLHNCWNWFWFNQYSGKTEDLLNGAGSEAAIPTESEVWSAKEIEKPATEWESYNVPYTETAPKIPPRGDWPKFFSGDEIKFPFVYKDFEFSPLSDKVLKKKSAKKSPTKSKKKTVKKGKSRVKKG